MRHANRGSRGLRVLANVLTGCNLAAGMAAAFAPGDARVRSRLILVGALCDSLDGPLARRSGKLTDEGARADGICDVVTCGVAPPILLRIGAAPRPSLIDRLAPRLYVAAIAWRVIKYGFPPRESHVFTGMPVTGAGVTMAIGFQLRLPPQSYELPDPGRGGDDAKSRADPFRRGDSAPRRSQAGPAHDRLKLTVGTGVLRRIDDLRSPASPGPARQPLR